MNSINFRLKEQNSINDHNYRLIDERTKSQLFPAKTSLLIFMTSH